MFGPFRLKSSFGRSYNVDPEDTLRAKRTFKDLGYYKTHKYGLTRYPDESLFDGIERFQKDNGLKRDGVMKPNGETATRLGQVMARREVKRPEAPVIRRPLVRSLLDEPKSSGRGIPRTGQRKTFAILDDLGERRRNGPTDAVAAKRALAWVGHFSRDRSRTGDGKTGKDLLGALRRFQQAAGLKVDGWTRPNGEAASALNRMIKPLIASQQSDTPDSGNPDKPPKEGESPKKDKKPEPDKKKCEQLRRAYIEAKADERAARYLRDANQKAYDQKSRDVERLMAVYVAKLKAFAAENALTILDIRKGKIPRGIVAPSDVLRAKKAYDTVREESKVLLEELRRARKLHEEAEVRLTEIKEKTAAAGCATSKEE